MAMPESVQQIEELIERGRFTYALQPVRATTGPAPREGWYQWLVRPDFGAGALDSDTFLEAVESLGLSLALDRRSVADALAWLGQASQPDRLSIRISGAALADDEFIDRVNALLETHGVQPRQLCFDLAVHATLSDLSGATRLVKAMRRAGARITLCNGIPGNPVLGLFGPLGYINHLKVDRMWVSAAPDSPSHLETLESIVEYARRLGLPVIAEGVDTPRHLALMEQLAIDYHQGLVEGDPMLVAESRSAGEQPRRIA